MALVAMRKAAPTRILRRFDRDSGTSDCTADAASAISDGRAREESRELDRAIMGRRGTRGKQPRSAVLRLGRRVAGNSRPIDVAAALVLGVSQGGHAEELPERSSRRTREPLVLIERKDDDVASVVVNQLGTVGKRASNDVTKRALRQMKRPAE
jgi:hypothetical protein